MITYKNCDCTFTEADEQIFKEIAEEKMARIPLHEKREIHKIILSLYNELSSNKINRSEKIDLCVRVIRFCEAPEAWQKI